jgi:hypothetical protein
MDNSIWLTSAVEDGHSLRALCLAADTGQTRWDVEVFRPENPQHVNVKNTHASPSPVVEPGRLYVHFGAMGTACLDSRTGKILWRNQDLIIDHGELRWHGSAIRGRSFQGERPHRLEDEAVGLGRPETSRYAEGLFDARAR